MYLREQKNSEYISSDVVDDACSSLPAENATLPSSVAAHQNHIYNILNHQWKIWKPHSTCKIWQDSRQLSLSISISQKLTLVLCKQPVFSKKIFFQALPTWSLYCKSLCVGRYALLHTHSQVDKLSLWETWLLPWNPNTDSQITSHRTCRVTEACPTHKCIHKKNNLAPKFLPENTTSTKIVVLFRIS